MNINSHDQRECLCYTCKVTFAKYKCCKYYGTAAQCIETFTIASKMSYEMNNTCSACAILLLHRSDKLSNTFGLDADSKLCVNLMASFTFLALFDITNITILRYIVNKRKYFRNFMIFIDTLMIFWGKILEIRQGPYDQIFQYYIVTSDLADKQALFSIEITNATISRLNTILFSFLSLVHSQKHVLWLMKIKNGYYFNKYVINSLNKFVEDYKQAKYLKCPQEISSGNRTALFYCVLKFSQKHKRQLSDSLSISKRENTFVDTYNISEWILEIYNKREHHEYGVCVECLLQNQLSFGYRTSKWNYYQYIECGNRLCQRQYYTFVYGIQFNSKTLKEWSDFQNKRKCKINKFYKCKQ
eukprot:262932_1